LLKSSDEFPSTAEWLYPHFNSISEHSSVELIRARSLDPGNAGVGTKTRQTTEGFEVKARTFPKSSDEPPSTDEWNYPHLNPISEHSSVELIVAWNLDPRIAGGAGRTRQTTEGFGVGG